MGIFIYLNDYILLICSTVAGSWSRGNSGGLSRGFATYELSDKENTDEDNLTDEESKQKQTQNQTQSTNNDSKFQGRTFHDNTDIGLYRVCICCFLRKARSLGSNPYVGVLGISLRFKPLQKPYNNNKICSINIVLLYTFVLKKFIIE